jgi:hypothetical protein
MNARPSLEQSMQEERIRAALNRHWHASAVGDANAEPDIYADLAFVIITGRASESSDEASRQAVRLRRKADSRKRGSLGHGIRNRVPGATSIWSSATARSSTKHNTSGIPLEAPAWRRQWVRQIA